MSQFVTRDGVTVSGAMKAVWSKNTLLLREKGHPNGIKLPNIKFGTPYYFESNDRIYILILKPNFIVLDRRISPPLTGHETDKEKVNQLIDFIKSDTYDYVISKLNENHAIKLNEDHVVAVTVNKDSISENDDDASKFMYVTRSGQSCNSITTLLSKKKDPGLSISGIINCIVLHQPQQENTSVVYVSVSVRSWMTALLMYGTQEKLTLIISPFIKEYGYNVGNMPETKEIQKIKFENLLFFLNKLQKAPDFFSNMQNDNRRTNFLEKINKHKLFFAKVDKLVTCKVEVKLHDKVWLEFEPANKERPSLKVDRSEVDPSDHPLFYKKLFPLPGNELKSIIDYSMELLENITPQPIEPNEYSAKTVSNYNPNQHVDGYSKEMTSYYPDGILKFYEWIRSNGRFPIFVVSHSQLMQDSLNAFKPARFKKIKGHTWTVQFTCNKNVLRPTLFYPGVTEKQTTKHTYPHLQFLCNQDQSIAGELFFDEDHSQKSDMAKQYLNPITHVKRMVGYGKQRSKRRKNRRTRKLILRR